MLKLLLYLFGLYSRVCFSNFKNLKPLKFTSFEGSITLCLNKNAVIYNLPARDSSTLKKVQSSYRCAKNNAYLTFKVGGK